ncbi:MAG: hypothetical protein K2H22_09590 [Muribaculaceae bacterium]|nr:hypothetical protein [Muribaculaceae bacterium]
MKRSYIYLSVALLWALLSCGRAKVPSGNVTDEDGVPSILPDYTGIVIPPNIAPMNFEIDLPGDEYVARVSGRDGQEIVASGNPIQWNIKEWHALLDGNKGDELQYEVYVRNGDEWSRYRFANKVAEEEIDPYISYRLIEPAYMQYSGITLNQRDLTSFDESVIFNNAAPCDERRGQCMNCHVPRNNYKDRASQFHVRNTNGGTVIMAGDSVVKVNLKTDSTLSAGVYPAWHPTLDLIAYSVNDTHQKFMDFGTHKIEVFDAKSGLVLYDMKTNEVSLIADDPALLETFPAWSPDGRRLYYSVASYPEGVTPENIKANLDRIRYDIVARDFDPATRRFSDPDTVVSASAAGESALLPRVSPDGRWLLYCKAPFGTFHIWHSESDLWMKDLAGGAERPLTNANSDDTESYHTWSSNGRWIVFSSRRDDGSYTRPYITYVSHDGSDSKAFVVPQESPRYYRELMKSYNVPEFLVSPVLVTRQEILEQVGQEPRNASFRR